MVEFEVRENEIELRDYSDDASLTELAVSLEAFRLTNGLKTKNCRGCGECCSDNIPVLGLDIGVLMQAQGTEWDSGHSKYVMLPEKPDPEVRKKAVGELVQNDGLTPLEASLLYEYNNAEPVILAKNMDGSCCFLEHNLCCMYKARPYSCGLYLCNMGERLSYIQEMIIRQGTWHAYNMLGWISENEISHNPFLKAASYDSLQVRDFEFELQNVLSKLFFYF